MNPRTALLALLFLLSFPASGAPSDSGKALLAFISDVTAFEGMFLGVHDYCGQFVDKPAAQMSRRAWLDANNALLSARDAAFKKLVEKVRPNLETVQDLGAWKKDIFEQSRNSDRLYQDLVRVPDKRAGCSRRLAELNAEAMTFERLAPASFAFWKQHHPGGPPGR